jgi:hypothetical protein
MAPAMTPQNLARPPRAVSIWPGHPSNLGTCDSRRRMKALESSPRTLKMSHATLQHAVYHEKPASVKQLIDAGHDVNETLRTGSTRYCARSPVHFAAWHGNNRIINMLMRAGAEVKCEPLAEKSSSRTGDLLKACPRVVLHATTPTMRERFVLPRRDALALPVLPT